MIMGILFFINILVLLTIFFLFGYSMGNKKSPKLEKIEEKKDKYMANLSTMLENIDNYDGTGIGQKDLPYDEEESKWI